METALNEPEIVGTWETLASQNGILMEVPGKQDQILSRALISATTHEPRGHLVQDLEEQVQVGRTGGHG